MIVGLGLDVVDVARVASILERSAESFLRRILHPDEDAARARTAEGPAYISGQFAAKEAVMKALGTGTRGIGWREVEVTRRRSGQPDIELHGRAIERARSIGIDRLAVSLSHSRNYAVASVVGRFA